MERNANYLPTVRSENSPPRSESNRSAIKKWPNVMGNMGLIAFQTCLFVFLNASSYGFDVHDQSTVSFCSLLSIFTLLPPEVFEVEIFNYGSLT